MQNLILEVSPPRLVDVVSCVELDYLLEKLRRILRYAGDIITPLQQPCYGLLRRRRSCRFWVIFFQTSSAFGDPLDLLDHPLLLDIFSLGPTQLRTGLGFLFSFKVSFEKHTNVHVFHESSMLAVNFLGQAPKIPRAFSCGSSRYMKISKSKYRECIWVFSCLYLGCAHSNDFAMLGWFCPCSRTDHNLILCFLCDFSCGF